MQNNIIQILINRGNDLLKQPFSKIEFTRISEADDTLNNLDYFPHAYVLACIMDRQISADRAWIVPYKISLEIGCFELSKLLELSEESYIEIFNRKNLHRFNNNMAKNFYSAIQKIHSDYSDDAANIWKECPRSATIVKRFLGFEGVGVKIATMAANILAREFKIPMRDYISIDISPDRHVMRVFKRVGFLSKDAKFDEFIYTAREFNPEYPGIFDTSCWEIGYKWCRPRKPKCAECYLNVYCPKII